MATEVIVTDEFKEWFEGLSEPEQDRVAFSVGLLEQRGVTLPFPYSSAISLWREYLEETSENQPKT